MNSIESVFPTFEKQNNLTQWNSIEERGPFEFCKENLNKNTEKITLKKPSVWSI